MRNASLHAQHLYYGAFGPHIGAATVDLLPSLAEPGDVDPLSGSQTLAGQAPAALFTHSASAPKAFALYGTTSTILRVAGSTSTAVSSTTVY
jgi:hypothetical protein